MCIAKFEDTHIKVYHVEVWMEVTKNFYEY